MKPGTIIRLTDGRVGTICWRHLDGEGGVWGEHDFLDVEENFSDEWPAPDFMLREKKIESSLQRSHLHFGGKAVECVGEIGFEVIRRPGEEADPEQSGIAELGRMCEL